MAGMLPFLIVVGIVFGVFVARSLPRWLALGGALGSWVACIAMGVTAGVAQQ
jgi:hypothetical protein